LFDRITAMPLTRASVQALGRKMHFCLSALALARVEV
jgi:hypothetical protein